MTIVLRLKILGLSSSKKGISVPIYEQVLVKYDSKWVEQSLLRAIMHYFQCTSELLKSAEDSNAG